MIDTNDPGYAHLHAVHFVLAYNLDSNIALLARCVAGAVDVAESSIAHLVGKFPALEARVAREFALAGILLGDKFGELLVIDTLLALAARVLVIGVIVHGLLCA